MSGTPHPGHARQARARSGTIERPPVRQAVGAVEAASLEMQRAVLVARLMDVDPEWGNGPTAAPGWWLETWARRLAQERLPLECGRLVVDWFDRAAAALGAYEASRSRSPVPAARDSRLSAWLAVAKDLQAEGARLEARLAAELVDW